MPVPVVEKWSSPLYVALYAQQARDACGDPDHLRDWFHRMHYAVIRVCLRREAGLRFSQLPPGALEVLHDAIEEYQSDSAFFFERVEAYIDIHTRPISSSTSQV